MKCVECGSQIHDGYTDFGAGAICNRCFLLHHIYNGERHEDGEPWVCDLCGKVIDDDAYKDSYGNVLCPECEEEFERESDIYKWQD